MAVAAIFGEKTSPYVRKS